MGDKVGGQLRQRPEEGREDALPGPDQRVGGIGHVVGHRPVVGVGDDLHAVPDVVEVVAAEAAGRAELAVGIEGLAVRELVARRERVLDVLQSAGAVDHDVRVLVELEERRDEAHALALGPVEQELAAARDLVGDQQVQVAEPDREQEPVEGRVEGNSRRALPDGGHDVGVNVSLPRG